MEPAMQGFLYKEGHDMLKSWQRRWCVLQGSQLLYYGSDKDVASGKEALGYIPIAKSVVESHQCRRYPSAIALLVHPDFQKELGHTKYVLASDSPTVMRAWVKAIGMSSGEHAVRIVKTLCRAIRAKGGLREEGLFRVPAEATEVKALKVRLEMGKPLTLETLSSPHVPAAALKMWFREWEEPLIPRAYYAEAISPGVDVAALLEKLPEVNRLVLAELLDFTQEALLPANVAATKMDADNLGMVLSKSLLANPNANPMEIAASLDYEKTFVKKLFAMQVGDDPDSQLLGRRKSDEEVVDDFMSQLTAPQSPAPPAPPVAAAGEPPAATASSAPAAASEWQEALTPDGRVYYFNRSLLLTVWQKPPELMTAEEQLTRERRETAGRIAAACQPKSVSDVWRQAATAEGKVYFYNQQTGATTWERPPELGPASPSAAPAAAPPPEAPQSAVSSGRASSIESASTIPAAATPPRWTETKTPDGRVYYWDPVSGQTVWQKPKELQSEEEVEAKEAAQRAIVAASRRRPSLDAVRPLPEGWRRAQTNDGKEYFYNEASGATSWSEPNA